MKCTYCSGNLVRSSAPLHVDRKGVHITFDSVPAWVCAQCGEPHFEDTDVEVVQSIVAKIDDDASRLRKVA